VGPRSCRQQRPGNHTLEGSERLGEACSRDLRSSSAPRREDLRGQLQGKGHRGSGETNKAASAVEKYSESQANPTRGRWLPVTGAHQLLGSLNPPKRGNGAKE
jgi:hypothetical protein